MIDSEVISSSAETARWLTQLLEEMSAKELHSRDIVQQALYHTRGGHEGGYYSWK